MNLANGQYGNIQATSEYLDEEKKGNLTTGHMGFLCFLSVLKWEIKNWYFSFSQEEMT